MKSPTKEQIDDKMLGEKINSDLYMELGYRIAEDEECFIALGKWYKLTWQKAQDEILDEVDIHIKDTKHNIAVCEKGIELNDSNLEYHRWNLSAYKKYLLLLEELRSRKDSPRKIEPKRSGATEEVVEDNNICDCKMLIGGSGKLCPDCRKVKA